MNTSEVIAEHASAEPWLNGFTHSGHVYGARETDIGDIVRDIYTMSLHRPGSDEECRRRSSG